MLAVMPDVPDTAGDREGNGTRTEESPQELTLRGAQRLVDAWMRDRGWTYWQPLAQLARMTEELGEVARLVNHLYGEKPKKTDEAEQDLGLELADLLYTMICLANSRGIDLQRALERALEKYGSRDANRYDPPDAGTPP
jgi:NTP pyrophosphatase (non-canonical NTP hydrolase)